MEHVEGVRSIEAVVEADDEPSAVDCVRSGNFVRYLPVQSNLYTEPLVDDFPPMILEFDG